MTADASREPRLSPQNAMALSAAQESGISEGPMHGFAGIPHASGRASRPVIARSLRSDGFLQCRMFGKRGACATPLAHPLRAADSFRAAGRPLM